MSVQSPATDATTPRSWATTSTWDRREKTANLSRHTYIFVAAPEPATDLMSVLEHGLSRRFIHEDGEDPYIRLDRDAIHLGRHDFGDHEISWPDGSDVPLHSEYRVLIDVRDTERNQVRQEAIGWRIFDALVADGRWKAVIIDDMRRIVGCYDPPAEPPDRA